MKRYKKKTLKESSWSRIIHHIEAGTSFAVISAYEKEYPLEVNFKKHEELRQDIRKMGYGYIEQKSGYSYINKKDNQEGMFDEESFFIPLITKKEALDLGNSYKQESILFKDDTGFYCLLKNGKIDTEFKTKRDRKTGQITFEPKILKYAFSQLKKATDYQRKQKFAYVIKECVYIDEYRIPTRSDAYRGMKEGKIPEAKYIRIL